MRRILLRLSILVLAFGLGVGVSTLWQLYKSSELPVDTGSTGFDVAVIKPVASNEITIIGGMDACGPLANFHTLELSDGTQISQSCRKLSSPAAVARALQKKLANAEIAERSVERDATGRPIGERILITSPQILRLSVYEKSLCETQAASLTHLRLYESRALHPAVRNPAND